jgi:hypothetical protein
MTDAERERTRARRAVALTLHPDVGGDAAQFTAALAAIDRRSDVADVAIRHSRLRVARRLLRQTRGRLPMGRRFISL